MVRQVADGVHLLRLGGANAYLVETDDGLALVDCGTPGKADDVRSAVARLGLADGRIRTILVTHHHVDHVGSLAAVARASGAPVWAPRADAAVIQGEVAPPPPGTRIGRLLWPVLRRLLPDAEPAVVGREIDDGDDLPLGSGSRAVHTPGHTPGHTAYLLDRDGGVLIAGDAASNLVGIRSGASLIMAAVASDPAAARASLAHLSTLQFEVAVFGHGRPLNRGASERFREAVRRR
ncbi:MAG TPA: MBL fold metallo-hydrolase [Cryptosporangiaceae bacterium]|nr:MBL fold metallo-hydrolase [Cryptosporangiaceae bacterium]